MKCRRFLLIADPSTERRAAATARVAQYHNWHQLAVDGPIEIFVDAAKELRSSEPSAGPLLVGTIFHRHGSNDSTADIDAATLQDLHRGSFSRLLQRFWGAFVVIDWTPDCMRIARDPSAAMSCYYARDGDTWLVASDAGALIDARGCRPQILLDCIAYDLYSGALPSPTTALEGITELLPGTLLEVSGNSHVVKTLWSPWDHVQIDDHITIDEQVDRVQRAVENSISAWHCTTLRPLVGVSGGLDSSIVAACLDPRKSEPLCVTLWDHDADGDERVHARILCAALGLALREERYKLDDISLSHSTSAMFPRPTGHLLAQPYNAAVRRVARDHDADVFFSGNGGDNVFAFSQSAVAIADHFLHHGPTIAIGSTIRDICDLTGCSIARAIGASTKLLHHKRSSNWRPIRHFLAPGVLDEFDHRPLEHPWLESPDDALPGQTRHVAALLRVQRHLVSPRSRDIPVINPLMAQPIIETCLAIPSWQWCHGGMNRALARRAFDHRLPAQIAYRSSKGGPDGFAAKVLQTFRPQVSERLLEGRLAQAGIVDRDALENTLRNVLDWNSSHVRILELIETEAWLEHWSLT